MDAQICCFIAPCHASMTKPYCAACMQCMKVVGTLTVLDCLEMIVGTTQCKGISFAIHNAVKTV